MWEFTMPPMNRKLVSKEYLLLTLIVQTMFSIVFESPNDVFIGKLRGVIDYFEEEVKQGNEIDCPTINLLEDMVLEGIIAGDDKVIEKYLDRLKRKLLQKTRFVRIQVDLQKKNEGQRRLLPQRKRNRSRRRRMTSDFASKW